MTTSHKLSIEPLSTGLAPLELYSYISSRSRNSFLLESAVGTDRVISYSFLGCSPKFVLRCEDGDVTGCPEISGLDPVTAIRKVIDDNRVDENPFPYVGGLVGYFSFEFARYLEKKVPFMKDRDFPDFELGMYKEGVVYDHSRFRTYYFSVDGADSLRKILPKADLKAGGQKLIFGEAREMSPRHDFEDSVAKAVGKIGEGEAFQIVLSRGVERNIYGDPFPLYVALREVNPSPYMFYLDFGERKVLGSSPETLVTVRSREVFTHPIAGTRPLGSDTLERRRYREEMLSDEKERAEHAMLVDLARNDLGKVCRPGSVYVPEFMKVEEFSHVQHIVSKVQGTLEEGKDAIDAFCAVFPAGTVSGAPKPRAMEIITEEERSPRGPYAGAVGYLSLNGNLDSAITIRSAFVRGDKVRFQAGAGIVYDSVPKNEYRETEGKLRAMVAALEATAARGARE
ncbi:MAG: anthranilate synthase component I family protein [Methanomassiliicoccales archaeon]|nr:MAG: anthranilate synthase component I family protein [Methanomassiliicoccales archaeon]